MFGRNPSLIQLFRHPSDFFASAPKESSGSWMLLIGIVCLCFGILSESAMQYYLISRFGGHESLVKLFKPEQIILVKNTLKIMMLGAPLIAFFGVHLFSSALHVTASFFISDEAQDVSYEQTQFIVCAAQIPMIFSVIPIIGPSISALWGFIVMIQGLKYYYSFSTFSALIVILAPALFLKLTWGWALQQLALSL